MAALPRDFGAALAAVRETHAAHATAVDALERTFDAEMAQLANDRAAFVKDTEDKVAREEVLQERIRASAPPPDELVNLNVGGARFETSRAVLTKVGDSMLGRMFGRCDAMLQADPSDGSIFIDRDGERFGMLLDFLRGDPPDGLAMQRAIRALPEAAQDAMVQEMDYFGLEAAVFSGRPWTDDATFRLGPTLDAARGWCCAVAAGGLVMVFGGGAALETTEVLDTQTMTFTTGPDMITGRSSCAAVQLDADRVLVVGGTDADNEELNTTEIFHLATRTFTPGPDMHFARYWCAAVTLDARRILVIGGCDGVTKLSTTEIFSLDTMAFTPGPTMASRRWGIAAVALDEHRIMVAGGITDLELASNTTEVLDIRTSTFAPGPAMGLARSYCSAVQVDAEHVLVIGGEDSSETALATTELLNVATMAFEPGPAMQIGRTSITAVRLVAAEEALRILVLAGGESTTEVLAVDAQRGARVTRHRR